MDITKVTAFETVNVMKDLHALLLKNDIATVDKVVLTALGAPTLAETVQIGK